MEKQPSGTVTLLFTDIEGSTDLVRELRDRYADVLAAHRQIIREAAERHRGEEIDTQGDAFFFTFGRAREAILAAAEAQRALADYDWPEGKHVRVRMGIHTGEPGRTAAGYHGLGVVRGARISAAAHGGQVLVSDATRSVVADDELPGMAFRDLGEHELKGLEQPQRLWQLVIDGLPSTFPPLRVGSPPAAGEVAPRRRRGRWLVVAGIVAVVGAAAAGLTFALTGSTHVAVVSNSVAVVDPATNRVVGDIRVG